MISLYSGTPGSGKSLHLASRLYHRMKNVKKPIICNFNCDFSRIKHPRGEFHYIDNLNLTVDYLINFSQEYKERKHYTQMPEDEILLVIDECQLMFNSRDYGKKNRGDWVSFFTQHRKLGYEVVLIAQFDRMLDRQIRSVIEYNLIHRKVSNFGIKGKIISLLMGGNVFVAVKVWYPLKEKVNAEWFHAYKKYYSIYDTFTLFEAPQ